MDCNLVWAKSIGCFNAYDNGKAITCDAIRNIYVSGIFTGVTDFDPSAATVLILILQKTAVYTYSN